MNKTCGLTNNFTLDNIRFAHWLQWAFFCNKAFKTFTSVYFCAMKVDYIIVGCGLAGIAFCEQLRLHNKTFVVFDNGSQQSTQVAAGLYNPVTLKRFTEAWRAKEQLILARDFYIDIENLLGVPLDRHMPVLRKIASVEEQNEWAVASDKPNLKAFLVPKIIKNHNPNIKAPFGFGKVLNTGKIDTQGLVFHYMRYLKSENNYVEELFSHQKLSSNQQGVEYKSYQAKFIIFAEGFGMKKNPFFDHLPLIGVKGEILKIHAPDLKLDHIVKSSIFVIPEGDDHYTVGATYDWDDKTNQITEKAKNELSRQLEELIDCDYKIVDQVAGVRPTVKDRRPLVGIDSNNKNIAILNGLGTRGVMIAPMVARHLFRFLENGEPLNEINIDRFRRP